VGGLRGPPTLVLITQSYPNAYFETETYQFFNLRVAMGKILSKKFFLSVLTFFALSGCLCAQTLIFDRGLSANADAPIGWTEDTQHFVGDDFIVGATGEIWIIDRIRTWVIVDVKEGILLGDLFEKITLWGGLAGDSISDNKGAECACHDTVPLKTGKLSGKASDSPDIQFSQAQDQNHWQIDFNNLRWSVPGGAKLQFGINATGRPSSTKGSFNKWFNCASATPKQHSLRVFSQSGKLESFLENSATLKIQVWGHPAKN
jgi:hypothetical protein